MALTRKLLRELNLDEPAIDRIIAAHIETVDALRTERDEARATASEERTALTAQIAALTAQAAEATRIQSDFDAYRARIDADRLAAERRSVLRAALLDAGANPQAVDLLATAATLPDDAWQGGHLADPAGALAPLKERYAALFAQPVAIPTPRIAPPVAPAAALTRDDVGRMSEQEILANWGAVQSALRG